MILNSRKYDRRTPTRSAKNIFIIAEGVKREYQYFNFFRELDSRIKVEVYKLKSYENNSPKGLLNIAKAITSGENDQYFLEEGDELWIVFDTDIDKTDSRSKQILTLRKACTDAGWNTAQSNPCFEVWLYFHFKKSLPKLKSIYVPKNWKGEVNEVISGGFDSRKHPVLIEEAKDNAKASFSQEGGIPTEGSTEVHYLADSILEVISDKIKIEKMSSFPNLIG